MTGPEIVSLFCLLVLAHALTDRALKKFDSKWGRLKEAWKMTKDH